MIDSKTEKHKIVFYIISSFIIGFMVVMYFVYSHSKNTNVHIYESKNSNISNLYETVTQSMLKKTLENSYADLDNKISKKRCCRFNASIF